MSAGPVDPVGLAVIQALARRAAGQQGLARQVLLQRVEQLRARRDAACAGSTGGGHLLGAPAVRRPALAGLTELVDRLGRVQTPPAAPSGGLDGPARASRPQGVPPAPLKAVVAFKDTWARLRAEQRLRQALAQVPDKAGPLHSAQVVHRMLRALHELSPAYLDAFMAHVDTLLGLEQAGGLGDLVARPAARADRTDRGAVPRRADKGRRRPAGR